MIKQPIRTALFDELIRLILIQVQKEKVDVEKAMLALDKLLKSNGNRIYR
jgi:nuclear-control-of-ATPase protein 2